MKLPNITIDFLENNFPEIVEILTNRGFEAGKEFYLIEEKTHFCFIRQQEVTRLTSIPKSTLPAEIEDSNFPAPVDLTTRSRGWLKSEVHAWMRRKLKERDDKKVEREKDNKVKV